jgi:hypothetical protein
VSGGQPKWLALSRLKQNLRREFRNEGVHHIEYVVAFTSPYQFWAWLGTSTDAERDQLANDPTLTDRVRRLAEKRGLGALLEGVSVESQETVDREYEGSWFYRLR